MLKKVVPPDRTGDKVERKEDEDQDKKNRIDISQVAKNFLPLNTPKEKKEKNQSKEEDYAQTNYGFFHNESSILSSQIFQVNLTKLSTLNSRLDSIANHLFRLGMPNSAIGEKRMG